MLSYLTPHLQLNHVFDLTAERFRGLNRTGLLLDVDCTLKDYTAKEIGDNVRAWVNEIRLAGAKVCLVSNGRSHRVAKYASALDVPFISKAFKPFPFGCRAALRLLGLRAHESTIVGDQIFADVLAGRLAGLFTVLVRPTSSIEPWFTRIKRPFERSILAYLERGRSTALTTVGSN
jgi:putative phosphatase